MFVTDDGNGSSSTESVGLPGSEISSAVPPKGNFEDRHACRKSAMRRFATDGRMRRTHAETAVTARSGLAGHALLP